MRRRAWTADRRAVPRSEEPAGLGRHGRLGRDDLLQHRRSGQAQHSRSPRSWKDLTKPVYKGQIVMPHPASSRHRFLRRVGVAADVGRSRRLEVHGRSAREHRAVHALGLASRAPRRPTVNTSSASRSSTAPTARKRRASRSTSCSRRRAWAGISRPSASTRARRTWPQRRSCSDWSISDEAMALYANNFAIVAVPSMNKPLPNVPADYGKRLVKNDFAWAAKNREQHPGRVEQALRVARRRRSSQAPGRPAAAMTALRAFDRWHRPLRRAS